MQLEKTFRRARVVALAAIAAVVVSACGDASASTTRTRTALGAPVAIGQGTARSYVTITDGVAVEVGVALSEGALSGLPGHHSPGAVQAEGHTTFEYVLDLPKDVAIPYKHVLVNWNPGGHEPPGIYDAPHFDFHFYVTDNAERLAIDPKDPEYQKKAERKPPAELIPARYIMPAPLAFARMGVHWVDTTSAELHGKPFTATFIYGTWDGKVIFAEPMLTKALLESKTNFSAELPMPPVGGAKGGYAGAYSVRWDEATKEYRIALTGFGKA